jgi:hypothetical protein
MVLLVSLVLQLCDLATTLVFLQRGVGEANPLVGALIRVSGQPAVAVLLVKAAGCGLVAYASRSRRIRLLKRANLPFALCVVWNLVAIATA